MIDVNKTSQVLEAIEGAFRLVLMTHANPDGDAVGSLLGLRSILRKRYPEKEMICICRDSAPSPFHFMDHVTSIRQEYGPEPGDLIIFLDAAEPKLTDYHGELPWLFDPALARERDVRTIKIDHHPLGSDFGIINIVDSSSASTAEIIVELADAFGYPISPAAATCLLTGIYTDTGSMMHSNTTPRVYRTAARLLGCGAESKTIMHNVFHTTKLSTLKLWGRVLENISLTDDGAAVSALTMADFHATGSDFSELTGAIDYVNSIPGMRFSMVLSERNGKVKGSLRTLHDDVDVAAMAQKFSGGGHRKAAGFSVDGVLEKDVRWKVKPAVAIAGNSEPPVGKDV